LPVACLERRQHLLEAQHAADAKLIRHVPQRPLDAFWLRLKPRQLDEQRAPPSDGCLLEPCVADDPRHRPTFARVNQEAVADSEKPERIFVGGFLPTLVSA
jgi:hypothetical protein